MRSAQISKRIHNGNVRNPHVNVLLDGPIGWKQHEGVSGSRLVQQIQHILGGVRQPHRKKRLGLHEVVVAYLKCSLVAGTHELDFLHVDSVCPAPIRIGPKMSQKGPKLALNLPSSSVLGNPFAQWNIKGFQVNGIVPVQILLVNLVVALDSNFVFFFFFLIRIGSTGKHASSCPSCVRVFLRLHGIQCRSVNPGISSTRTLSQTQSSIAGS
mmetsp:Transcript_10720/g.27087  ORF Transcript_10720/g.27087 Transcript_10720/m.27087 type:complete len:212 (-) Transcript_10720:642-1277(-)